MDVMKNQSIIFARNDDGELTLYHPENCAFFTLNSSGEWLWKALDENLSTPQLVEKFRSNYEVPESEASRDVDEFFEALLKRDLIKVRHVTI